MPNLSRIAAGLAIALGLLTAQPALAQDFPELTGRVVDAANIIPDDQEAALTAKLAALETQSQRQLVVATLPDLQGYDISDYGYQLGREWGIGDAERNDGALIIVAPNERKTRIEIGYGLEGIMTDALSSVIVNQQMLPRFREGDYAGGINAAADTIIQQLTLPEEEARAIATQAAPERSRSNGSIIDFPTIIFLGFFLFFIIIPMLRGKRGKRYRRNGTLTGSSIGDIILWEVGSAALRGGSRGRSGGGWGGGGFGGGGGFSGGGGSFGGGGASGGW
ncbi:methanol dehydrogenase [Altererythrobacter luteolus]|uniref:Methanol dehydrogenase n=1 Tax=Pontixanthobacter luteolus TaxID=295089 RepID=A0A6I4UX16_9SPHN|nr:TPM domain-containing protein [Pontixanthobacter luteolus]MXP46103.1 methanol dehydrogenase [Pontixanthobacter luteolus]